MNTTQRDVVFQRWSDVIHRETRDLVSLKQISARVLADTDVRDDPTLQSMIRAELQDRRAELDQELQDQESSTTPPETRPTWRSELPEPVPTTTPDQDREVFSGLAQTLLESLERGDDKETCAIFGRMQALQEQRPGVIPVAVIAECEQRVEKLRVHQATHGRDRDAGRAGCFRVPQWERAGLGEIDAPTHGDPCGPPASTR